MATHSQRRPLVRDLPHARHREGEIGGREREVRPATIAAVVLTAGGGAVMAPRPDFLGLYNLILKTNIF